MSSTATPFGLKPVYHPSGDIPLTAILGGIASGYASDIPFNSPVVMDTTGVLHIATNSGDIAGVFMGCEFFTQGNILESKRVKWTAGTTYVAGTMTAYIVDNPDVIYAIQANGSLAQTAIGDEANFVNPGTSVGDFSNASLNSTLVGAGNQGQLRIYNLAPGVNNAWGDAFTNVHVEIASNQRRADKVAI